MAPGGMTRRPAGAGRRRRDRPANPWHAPFMRQLLLLRHAKSSWDDPALSDHARPLNARGRRSAAAMAVALRTLDFAPELVLVSSARRTLQTLEALGPLPGLPTVEATDDLYLAPWTALLATLRAVPAAVRSVLLVAHNPGLHDLVLSLASGAARPEIASTDAFPATSPAAEAPPLPGLPAKAAGARPADLAARLADGYPTGTLCELAVSVPWAGLEPGSGRLVRLVAPGDLSARSA